VFLEIARRAASTDARGRWMRIVAAGVGLVIRAWHGELKFLMMVAMNS
jgi:hypothetical protein